ncbi:MAG: ATP-dependent DNA helicase RecG [Alicyclobacillus sp.]|nr:ATP-dependent DNA helicase RecG [Alicyclobacillus sp.]
MEQVPVTLVPGVGHVKQGLLAELDIYTVDDLLHYFPVRFEDRRPRPLETVTEPAQVTVLATVEGAPELRWRGRKSVLRARVRVDHRHLVTAMWFNQHYLRGRLGDGRVLRVTGRYDPDRRTLVVSHTEFGGAEGAAFVPVYRSTKGLSTSQIQQIIDKALARYGHALSERLPRELVDKYRLWSHRRAVAAMHRPLGDEDRRQAHRRLAFEEFFLFQLQLQALRARRAHSEQRPKLAVPEDAFETFTASLPFPLTNAQLRACRETTSDLVGDRPMVRLLQGDVGSGKTWVALWAAYAVTRAGGQTAFMAPTEILAEQHHREAHRRLQTLGVRVELLTGRTPAKERAAILGRLAAGSVDLVIGTHALLTADVRFARLELVMTDEQHRFGVSQRNALRDKGRWAHVLMLSATPIPRTLALALYGDLDVSVLDERPPGRKPIRTVICGYSEEPKVILRARQVLAAGRQVYVVAPLIEEGEGEGDRATGAPSAVELEARMRDAFAGFSVGLLHGRMPGQEKDAVMRSFAAGEIAVLVSTTVIEVGIDVLNATLMVIYGAERFGLAQLHQLRGRVGRGAYESCCVLMSDARQGVSGERLRTLTASEDGFYIAERDLELRGPGEFLGVRQSGLPEFSVGDLTTDLRVMEVARDEAARLVADPDFWLLPKYAALRQLLEDIETPPSV